MVRVGTGTQNQPQQGDSVFRSKSRSLQGPGVFSRVAAQLCPGPASFLLCLVPELTRAFSSLRQCPSPFGSSWNILFCRYSVNGSQGRLLISAMLLWHAVPGQEGR